MKKIAALIGTVLMAASLAVPATPVAAQSFSFGSGMNDSPRCDRRWDGPRRWNGWDNRYRSRRGGSISIDLGPIDIRVRVPRAKIIRCEARYRSYDRSSDTYMGFDGDRHRCRRNALSLGLGLLDRTKKRSPRARGGLR